MPFDHCLMCTYAHTIVVVAGLPNQTEFWLQRPGSLTAHPLLTMHLDAWPPFPHAEIVRICPLTFVSCSDMPVQLWLLLVAAENREKAGLRPRRLSTARPLLTIHLDV
jgi:hypothetical protein